MVAAMGYCELNMWVDSDDDKIDADVRHMPEVLEVQMEIYRGAEKWQLMRELLAISPSTTQATLVG